MDVDREVERILAMTDEEVMAEHLALYGGDKALADKAINMLQAKIQAYVASLRKH